MNHINQYNNEDIVQQITSQGTVQAFRLAKSIGCWIFKQVFKKLLSILVPILAPYIAAIVFFVLVFGFIYFTIMMLPRYIAEASNSPAVIFNLGKEDIWKLEQDLTLVRKYRKMDYDWLNKYRSFNTLVYQKPETVSGNGAKEDATVSNIWGPWMAASCGNPFLMPSSSRYDDIFKEKAQKYNLEFKLLKAVAFAESSFDPKAVSPMECLGIMQLSSKKIAEYGIKDPFNPEENIDGGARYISELLARFNNNKELAIAAYNAGPGAVVKYNGIPPYEETRSYVRKVMSAYTGRGCVIPSFNEGSNIVAEQEQVEPHLVHWALLAALDRVLGDPIVHGKHGLETEQKGRIPQPENRFKELEPELTWKDFKIYYYHRWVVHYSDENGEHSETYTEEYTHNIKLLSSAKTYEANYSYTWNEKIIEKESENGEDYKKIIVPELVTIERSGPYYEKLRKILQDNGLKKDTNVELVLRLAMNMDDTFNIDANLTSQLLEIYGNTENTVYVIGFGELAWPVNGPITSPYGYRVHPISGEYRLHTGIDIGVDSGTEVHSAGDGKVVFVGDNGGYGKTLIIDHGKYRTLYAHLMSYNVRLGDVVKKGHVIAKSDNTGLSDGPHLHFEVRTGVNKTVFVNPVSLLS